MQVLSSLSGITFYAPSAGFAPTNSADVSAIASSYQVVSATATQLYAGTAYVTSVNDNPLSASRAGNAANASLANSAWYDGTGRLISALPDSAAVSAIASSYAESAASSKLDSTASSSFYPADNPSGFISSVDLSNYATTAYVDSSVSNKLDATASSQFLTSVPSDYATTAYVDSSISGFAYESAVSGWTAKQDTLTFGYDGSNNISSIDGSALAGGGGGASYSAGAGIDITSNVISAKVDGTTIDTNASGELTVIGGGGGTQADWTESDPTDPSYIENKPTPKTLTAGTGISISEGVSTIMISSNASVPVDQTYDANSANAQSGTAVADAIGNLPTNLTSAQIEALKVALGVDETVLWEGTATNSCTISEAFSNFEKIRLTLEEAGSHKATEVIIEPTNKTNWPTNIPYGNSIVGGIVFLHIELNGTTLSVSKAKMMSIMYAGNDASWSNDNGEWLKNALLKVVGIHRSIASN